MDFARVIPRDTSREAYELQMSLYRALPPGRRAELVLEISDFVREFARDGIRRRNPAYSELEVDQALTQLLYGRDIVERLWPGQTAARP